MSRRLPTLLLGEPVEGRLIRNRSRFMWPISKIELAPVVQS
jgi:hypothetical protein